MTINLKVEEHIYKLFFIFKIFLYLFRGHCQGCQNNPLSMDPHSSLKGRSNSGAGGDDFI
jgi:hypothetical protein